MNKKIKKLIIIISCLQMVAGIITIVVGVLFFMGKIGNNVGVCVISAILCVMLSCINMCLLAIRAKSK
jgi:hypothetical protein